MKIESSKVAMESKHQELSVSFKQVNATIWTQGDNKTAGSEKEAIQLTISERARQFIEEQERLKAKMKAQNTTGKKIEENGAHSRADLNKTLLEQLIEMLRKLRGAETKGPKKGGIWEVFSSHSSSSAQSSTIVMSAGAAGGVALAPGNGEWQVTQQMSSFKAEMEVTSFSSVGNVVTADGRSISFNVEFEMSRSFMEALKFEKTDKVTIMTDPLVINMDSFVAGVSDQKFLFDLDSDGKKDEVSYLNKGSGFLSYDKNGDGVINDGGELFGTKSGNGFADLAEHDSDRNGWIDENDEIFNRLSVWIKDEDGNDKLLSLKEANVGAIYLGNVSTQFNLNHSQTNESNAAIRKTGVYLKETGEVGTVQHVDFAI